MLALMTDAIPDAQRVPDLRGDRAEQDRPLPRRHPYAERTAQLFQIGLRPPSRRPPAQRPAPVHTSDFERSLNGHLQCSNARFIERRSDAADNRVNPVSVAPSVRQSL